MGRGFAGGLIWGVLAAVFCLLCVVAYQSMTPEKSPETITLEVPAGSEFNQSRDDEAARSPKEISIANRAKVVKSELTEPDQALGVDRTIGSSAKVPTADANTISGLSNSSSTGSEMSIQRSLSLAEKPILLPVVCQNQLRLVLKVPIQFFLKRLHRYQKKKFF